jgi:hypothetical protein
MPRTAATARTRTSARPTVRAPRATVVEVVTSARGRNTTVQLRAARSGRVLFECHTTDARGAEVAVLAVERYCVERGLVLVMPANDTARAPQGSHAA